MKISKLIPKYLHQFLNSSFKWLCLRPKHYHLRFAKYLPEYFKINLIIFYLIMMFKIYMLLFKIYLWQTLQVCISSNELNVFQFIYTLSNFLNNILNNYIYTAYSYRILLEDLTIVNTYCHKLYFQNSICVPSYLQNRNLNEKNDLQVHYNTIRFFS